MTRIHSHTQQRARIKVCAAPLLPRKQRAESCFCSAAAPASAEAAHYSHLSIALGVYLAPREYTHPRAAPLQQLRSMGKHKAVGARDEHHGSVADAQCCPTSSRGCVLWLSMHLASCDRLLINCVSSTDAVMIEVCLMYFARSGRRMKAMVSEI